MQRPNNEEKQIKKALYQFIYSFSMTNANHDLLRKQLTDDGFEYFDLKNLDNETKYYSKPYHVSSADMEQYYLPAVENLLFPKSEREDGFHRYSRAFSLAGSLHANRQEIDFNIHSVDVILCPFEIGFITIRAEIGEDQPVYSRALTLADKFRILKNRKKDPGYPALHVEGSKYNEIEKFFSDHLFPGISTYFARTDSGENSRNSLPFTINEKMFVQALFCFQHNAAIDQVDLYRAGQLDGFNGNGDPYISTNNMRYVEEYCDRYTYYRWAPDTYYFTHEHGFFCLTNEGEYRTIFLANQMYGRHYYGLLLNLFHKIALVKLSHQYSFVDIEKDNKEVEEVEKLIRLIMTFLSKYYFQEIVTQTEGSEIFIQHRNIFQNDQLYTDLKHTLSSLFQYKEKISDKRSSYLLMILTIYSVISGIYGMNLVIEDLKGTIQWNKMLHYSFFEYIALFVTLSGVVVGLSLGFFTLWNWLKSRARHTEKV